MTTRTFSTSYRKYFKAGLALFFVVFIQFFVLPTSRAEASITNWGRSVNYTTNPPTVTITGNWDMGGNMTLYPGSVWVGFDIDNLTLPYPYGYWLVINSSGPSSSGTFSVSGAVPYGAHDLSIAEQFAGGGPYIVNWLTYSWPITITSAPTPNLTAGMSPFSAMAGTGASLVATISNTGDASTGATFTNLFQKATDSTGTNMTDIGTAPISLILSPGGSAFAVTSYVFSAVGTYYIRACADKSSAADLGVITESNENDNCSSWVAATVTVNDSPIVNISASPPRVLYGGSSTLLMSSSNATSCSLSSSANNYATGVSISPNVSVTRSTGVMNASRTYRFTCRKNSRSISSAVTISVCSQSQTIVNGVCSALPDLSGGSTTITPSTGTTGKSESFVGRVTNVYNGTAVNFPNFFQIMDEAKTQTVGTASADTVSSLSFASSLNVSGSYTFTSPGNYNVRVCANYSNMWTGNIPEVAPNGTKNNCGTWAPVTIITPTGCSYGTDTLGSLLTLLAPSTVSSNPTGGKVISGGGYKAPTNLGLGDICFRNDGGRILFVPSKTPGEFNSFWSRRANLGQTLIP